jgi:hypothetical protein
MAEEKVGKIKGHVTSRLLLVNGKDSVKRVGIAYNAMFVLLDREAASAKRTKEVILEFDSEQLKLQVEQHIGDGKVYFMTGTASGSMVDLMKVERSCFKVKSVELVPNT